MTQPPHCDQTSAADTSAGATSTLRRAETAKTGTSRAQTSIGASPASGKTSLASEESDLPGIRMELQELRRVGRSVTPKFTLFNDGNESFNLGQYFGAGSAFTPSIDGTYLTDPLTNTKYPVMIDSSNYNQCLCSVHVPPIAPKSKAVLWAKFALPAELQSATVVIPRFAPVEDAHLQLGKVSQAFY